MKTFYPNVTHGIINRVTNSLFSYQGWPTVARDEMGTLYVASSSFRMGHVCPFGKTAMYISRTGGDTWTPPIVINDTLLDDRDGGLLYMGDGRMLVSWFTLPGKDMKRCYMSYIKKALLACIYSKEKNRPFTTLEVFGTNALYCYGYIIASSALGLITTHTQEEIIIVDSINVEMKSQLIRQIKLFIASTSPENKDYNNAIFENVKRIFEILEE